MSEADWLAATYPSQMFQSIPGGGSERKQHLLAAACLRRIWHLLPGPRSRRVVELLEQFADGNATEAELAAARLQAWADAELVHNPEGNQHPSIIAVGATTIDSVEDMIQVVAEATAWVKVGTPEAISEPEEREQSEVVREIFGNPFRPVAFNTCWRTADVMGVARGIYEDRAFDRLSLLADALMDAGCADDQVLAHCRSDGPHVRGCWVVDLVLGKK